MATTTESDELWKLAAQRDHPVLSVYLNIDQARMENLGRGFEHVLDDLLRKHREALASEAERRQFDRDATQVKSFVGEYQPRGKTLVMFCDATRELFWRRPLRVACQSEARWDVIPYMRPLLEARESFKRYGVILTNRGQARLFTIFLREIEDGAAQGPTEAQAKEDVHRFEGPGMDHMRSQMQFQRKAEEHAKHHLKDVAALMDRLYDERPFQRLILAGPTEALTELKPLLSDRLQERLAGTLALPVHASEDEIRHATLKFIEQIECQEDKDLVARLLTAAAKNQHAVIGLSSTLAAAQKGRIRQLVYSRTFQQPCKLCSACDIVFGRSVERCPDCGKELQPVAQVLDRLLEKAYREGGETKQLRPEASEVLDLKAEGIGAILRY